MKTRLICAATLALPLLAGTAASQTDTTFTYQGVLDDGGSPADGTYTVSVSLWNAASGGTQLGSIQTYNNVSVSDGLFSVELDFGGAVLDGSQQWLQIAVNGSTLSPRQPVTRAPYAIQTRGLYVNANETFVGVGRDTQVTSAEVFGIGTNSGGFGGMYVRTGGTNGQPFYGYSVNGGADAYHAVDGISGDWYLFNSGAIRMTVESNGETGIGTTSPEAPLHVQDGSAGAVASHANSSGVFERSTTNYLSILSPDDRERGILFGDPESFVNGGIIYNNGSTPDGFEFRAGDNVTHMVLTSSGSVGVGISSPTARLHGVSFGGFSLDGVRGESTLFSGVGVRGRGGPTGFDFFADGPGTNYGSASSIRWKHDIQPISDALHKLAQIRGVTYVWDLDHGGNADIGFIAEEVGEVLPQIVAYETNGTDAIGLDYSKITPLLVEAVKQLERENDDEIAALLARIEKLENALLAAQSDDIASTPNPETTR